MYYSFDNHMCMSCRSAVHLSTYAACDRRSQGDISSQYLSRQKLPHIPPHQHQVLNVFQQLMFRVDLRAQCESWSLVLFFRDGL